MKCPHCGREVFLTTGTYSGGIAGGEPHKCPVCDGTGLTSRPPGISGDLNGWPATDAAPHNCRTCGGAGVLWRGAE